MGKVWVLDTGTKGTGASIVPLESTLAKPAPPPATPPRPPKPRPRRPKPPAPRTPPRFKVVDAVSGEVLVEGAGARDTVAALRELRSVFDARVYVRRPGTGSWRLLSLDEQRSLWRLRERTDPESGAP
jgi:hypothetical protein